jgi:hypothetical protein
VLDLAPGLRVALLPHGRRQIEAAYQPHVQEALDLGEPDQVHDRRPARARGALARLEDAPNRARLGQPACAQARVVGHSLLEHLAPCRRVRC